MARAAVNRASLTMTGSQWTALHGHLFPGDRAEHGAILRCGLAESEGVVRLLVREVRLADEQTQYVPGTRGHRALSAGFVLDAALDFAEDKSIYLAVHCHGGADEVAFSKVDLASHELGYPGLLELIGTPVVGALVFARNAVAGDLWFPDGTRAEIDSLVITDPVRRSLTPAPPVVLVADSHYDRQARLFGDRGQAILRQQTIGVVGLGGAGSLINELLARLGVGHVILIDPDRVETSNLSRLVGGTRRDAQTFLTRSTRPRWVRRLGTRLAARKVDVAARVARAASVGTRITRIAAGVEDESVARQLLACDHIFLAADSATARLVVNAICHQYLIPVTQVGAKVTTAGDGTVTDIFAVSRLITPGRGCLKCNGLISADRLRQEATAAEQLERQRYVDDSGVHAPSVITLNAIATAHAVNSWMLRTTGLVPDDEAPWAHFDAVTGDLTADEPRADPDCTQCGPARFARGDARRLPTKMAHS
jgi:molybdopterin/thiamine biosynthesis adenylyltransferase